MFLKSRMQIFPENFLFPVMQLVILLIFHFNKPLIQQQIKILFIIIIQTSLKDKRQLKELFLFATWETNFNFNSRFYKQVDVVAMGSPLTPVLANISMGFYKSKWLNIDNLNKSKLYLRHLDGILAVFDKEPHLLNFSDFLNKRRPNIKFTIETQDSHSVAFLDVFISGINNQNLKLQIYQESASVSLLLRFISFISFPQKISLIKRFIGRSFKICNK